MKSQPSMLAHLFLCCAIFALYACNFSPISKERCEVQLDSDSNPEISTQYHLVYPATQDVKVAWVSKVVNQNFVRSQLLMLEDKTNSLVVLTINSKVLSETKPPHYELTPDGIVLRFDEGGRQVEGVVPFVSNAIVYCAGAGELVVWPVPLSEKEAVRIFDNLESPPFFMKKENQGGESGRFKGW